MTRYRRASRAWALGLVHALVFLPSFVSVDFSPGAPAAFAQGGGGGTSGGGGGAGSGSSGASGAGVSAPGPSGISSADGLSPDIAAAGETGGIADFWAPRRLVQTAEKAATDAAHYAALATKAAEQTDGAQAGRGQPELADSARDAARVAEDA